MHLCTVHDALPVQEVLHTISSPYGVVQRIAIFRKNGVQALVEFDSNTSAARAKTNLEGADIYAGCCTLKTEYARVSSAVHVIHMVVCSASSHAYIHTYLYVQACILTYLNVRTCVAVYFKVKHWGFCGVSWP